MATIKAPKNAGGGTECYYRNGGFPAQPGDEVILDGDYAHFEIRNLSGTPEKPIIFRGTGKNRLGYNSGSGIILANCKHIIFEGAIIGKDDGNGYNETGANIHQSSYLEMRHCTLQNAKLGFFNNQLSGHYPDVFLHHNLIRNITHPEKTNFSEAFYLGQTSGLAPSVTSFPNLRIEDNIIENIGGDAIQIANGINVSVKRNKITNYGMHGIDNQWFGILCGGGTSGTFEDNIVSKGPGTPFQILGTGDVIFRNNTASQTATGAKQDGFYIRQSFNGLKVQLIGNKIDKVNRAWITEVTPGLVVKNEGNLFGVTIPPVEPPVTTVPKEVYDALKAQYDALVVSNNQLQSDYKAIQNINEANLAKLTQIKNIVG